MIPRETKREGFHPDRSAWRGGVLLPFVVALLAGCVGVRTPAERSSREDLEEVTARYRPGSTGPELPVLTRDSGIGDYLRFAMLNNPRIEAAYYDWFSSVESITAARSLPDPRLTFSADISDIVSNP